MDVDERDRATELLRQRAALGRFGELSLKSDDLDEILTQACVLVSEALQTNFAKVLACHDNGTELLVRAGVGWRPGVVGELTVPTGGFSAAGHALHTSQPVISNDVEHESRFEVPSFMRVHGIKAMVNVIIIRPDGQSPYGVLEVDSSVKRLFGDDDVDFLRSYANLLSYAVERFKINSELRDRADENERLLGELQHRVKNNLQVISSLIRLQAGRSQIPEVQTELTTIGNRVETLRLVHDQLHEMGGVDRVDLGKYLGVLSSSLLKFYGQQAETIRLITELEPVNVLASSAVPVGMIVTEFVTNSFKYAFDGGRGTIGLRLQSTEDRVRLSLWDDGKGMAEGTPKGTGMRLVTGFVRQIKGDSEWSNDPGTRLDLTFPVDAAAV